MAKQAANMPAQGILNRVQQCKFGGHAQHTAAPYAFVDGTGAFPHSGLFFNCVTGKAKGRRAASDQSGWRYNHDGHPDFGVNFSSRACGARRRALRVHTLELGKVTGTQRDVSGRSAGDISDPHEGSGAGGTSTSRAIPHDVLMCHSPRPYLDTSPEVFFIHVPLTQLSRKISRFVVSKISPATGVKWKRPKHDKNLDDRL